MMHIVCECAGKRPWCSICKVKQVWNCLQPSFHTAFLQHADVMHSFACPQQSACHSQEVTQQIQKLQASRRCLSINCQIAMYMPGSDLLPGLQVGAATETELEDRKLRIEDAKNATFAAVEEGIVPGGGAVFLHLSEMVPAFKDGLVDSEEKLGADIIFKALLVSAHSTLISVGHTSNVTSCASLHLHHCGHLRNDLMLEAQQTSSEVDRLVWLAGR